MNTRVVSVTQLAVRYMLVAFAIMATAVTLAAVPKTQVNAAACQAPATDLGSATAEITVATEGTYRVWSRINPVTAGNSSYLLEIDGADCYNVGGGDAIPANTWTWVDYQDATEATKIDVTLTAGTHSLKMIGNAAELKLDKVMFVSDTACVPTEFGNNCAGTGTGDGDTTAPIVELTAPEADAVVSGTVAMTAQASDDPGGAGMAKVEFFVNGDLVATDATAPYEAGWDSTNAATGTYTVEVVATDAAGNTSSDSVDVRVQAGGGEPDVQAPSTPADVVAVAEAHNRVKVTWNASTDNVAVTGYKVFRDDSQIADVTSGTEYVDNDVVGNTDYAYKVVAYDEIGNESAESTVVNVKTPAPTGGDPDPGGGGDPDPGGGGDPDPGSGAGDDEDPTQPTELKATPVTSTQINLTWKASTDNTGVKEYEVYRATGSAPATLVGVWDGTSVGSSGLVANTEYSFYVIAKDAAGNSSQPSDTVTAKTKESDPNGGLIDPTSGNGGGTGGVGGNVGVIVSVKIVIFINGQQQVFRTDDKGNYNVDGLPAGKFPVTFDHPNFFMNAAWIEVSVGQMTEQNMKMYTKDVRSLVNSFWNR